MMENDGSFPVAGTCKKTGAILVGFAALFNVACNRTPDSPTWNWDRMSDEERAEKIVAIKRHYKEQGEKYGK
jgi:hypothetical protein